MSLSPSSKNHPWGKCRPGTIDQMVLRERTLTRRKILKNTVLASASLFGIAASGSFVWSRLQDAAQPRQIPCSAVIGYLSELYERQLPSSLDKQVRGHLRKCPCCRKYYLCNFPGACI